MVSFDIDIVKQRFASRKRELEWEADPVLWAQDRCGDYLWSIQAQVLRSVRDNKRTLVASCHASGKTFLASRAIGWWVDVHPKSPELTRVITTAPTWNQVKNVMWAYVEGVKKSADIDGRINGKCEWTFPGYKFPTAIGRKPSDYDDSTFQGFHALYTLIVIDEAGGVDENIFTSVEANATDKNARILAVCNPDNPNSYAAKIWREQEKLPEKDRQWNLIRISAFDTPNFTGENVPQRLKDGLLQKQWVEDAKRRWGEEDPRYQAKVLAQFPDVGEDGLFNLGRVLLSQSMYEFETRKPDEPCILGVDVAMSLNGDFSVVASNTGGKIEILLREKGLDAHALSRKIGEICQERNVREIRVDVVGVGRGVEAVLHNYIPQGIDVVWVLGNAKAPNPLKWYNMRAMMYDTLSQGINRGEFYIPPDEAGGEKTEGLYNQFQGVRYEYRDNRLLIESKESMRKRAAKKRGTKSPDLVDAIAYATLNLSEVEDSSERHMTVDEVVEEFDAGFDIYEMSFAIA